MRHPIRSAIVAGTSALLLTAGAGTASAQGSLESALPFPLDLPGLAALITGADAPTAQTPATPGQPEPLDVVPTDLADQAYEGTVIAGVNEARTAVGADRLVSDPALTETAGARAAELAAGDTTTGDLPVPEAVSSDDRTTLELPAQATPPNVLTAMLGDTGMRERMLDGEFTQVGAGMATAEDGAVHVVLDFS